METFILTIFWVKLITTICRILNMAMGSYSNPASIGVYVADTALTAAIAVWAGFALWYS